MLVRIVSTPLPKSRWSQRSAHGEKETETHQQRRIALDDQTSGPPAASASACPPRQSKSMLRDR